MGRPNTQGQHKCRYCGTTYDEFAYRASTTKYCSRKCYDKARTSDPVSRFQYDKDENGCWVWSRYRSPDGYGRVGSGRTSQLAHRVSYEHYVGLIPEGMVIDHKCQNRACVNPSHLQAVYPEQNTHLGKVRRALRLAALPKLWVRERA